MVNTCHQFVVPSCNTLHENDYITMVILFYMSLSVCLSVCLTVSLSLYIYIYATVLCVGQSDIPFSSAARNLCVTFDSQLALKEQVNKLCQLALPGDQAGQFNPTLPFILKSARLSFHLLFSPGLTTVVPSLLALLGFSLRKLKERSTV